MKRIIICALALAAVSTIIGASPSSAATAAPSKPVCTDIKSVWGNLTKVLAAAGKSKSDAQMLPALKNAATRWQAEALTAPPAIAAALHAGATAALQIRTDFITSKTAGLARSLDAMDKAILHTVLPACNAVYGAKAKTAVKSSKVKAAGLDDAGCMVIEDEWGKVATALAGMGTTTTIGDAAATLKEAVPTFADQGVLIRQAKGLAMASALQAGSNAAARLRVDLLTRNAATLMKDSKALTHQIGLVVSACKVQFHH